MLSGRDPDDMLDALEVSQARLVVACEPPSPRALPAEDLAAAVRRADVPVVVVPNVARAVDRAIDEAGEDELVLVTGSLYTVGEARLHLVRQRL
jgi:folylpolyglutamate synthase/dihydropteroate synthase